MIQIENLQFNYGKRSKVFANLDLSLQGGHIYGLLGRNGTGKTTLLKIIMGLLFPKSGNCIVLGDDSSKRKPSILCKMFFMAEEFYTPSFTIEKYKQLYAPYYPHFNHEEFDCYLQEFELMRNAHLQKMSLGQKKKAMLAFAMAANTQILILDEPTNGLDIPSKSQFRRIIASLATENRCIIISTHQVRDIDKLIDSVIILDDREVVLSRDVEDICEKLKFTVAQNLVSEAIYSEESIDGYQTVLQNTDNDYTQLNLELFFNAVIRNKQLVRNIFNAKKQ